jgi:phosphate:Na+ symporter
MVFLGFGFVFFGMKLMIQTTAPLKESQLMSEIFALFAQNPAYAFLASAAFTALVQNSATTLGLAISLAFSGLITFPEALPVVLGANVGTCFGSFANSIGGGPEAKRVAISHLFFKITGASVALCFLKPFAELILELSTLMGIGNHIGFQIATTHVVFNLALSILFLPFLSLGAKLILKLVPEPFPGESRVFGSKFLDPHALEVPSLAFASAKLELLRMAEIAHDMYRNIIPVFENNNRELLEYVQNEDDKVDLLDRDIKLFLAKLSQESLNSEQARTQLDLVSITTDLEEICDIINKNILDLAEKKMKRGRVFSEEGWSEIKDIHLKVSENFQLMISALTTSDETIARKIERHEKHLTETEDQYRMAHLQRLHKGVRDTIESSYIHLELLSNFSRINSKLMAIVKAGLPKKAPQS